MSHEPVIDGWAGTTQDFSVFAHGEYHSQEDAQKAIEKLFGDVRYEDENGPFASMDNDTVLVCKPGKFAPMTKQATVDWLYDACNSEITENTTDDELEEMLKQAQEEAERFGMELYHCGLDFLTEMRDSKR